MVTAKPRKESLRLYRFLLNAEPALLERREFAMPTVTESDSRTLTTAPDSVGRRYVEAALHTGFGGIASRVFSGLAPIILARYLGPKEYGIYALVLSLVGIVAGAAHLGQNTALQKFLPEYSVKDPRRGGAILADTMVLVSGILVVVCAAFFLLSAWIASAIYHDASLTPVFQVSALIILFMSLFNLASSAVAGLQDFKAYSKAMVIRSAGFLVLAWAGVWLLGLYGALGGQLIATIIGFAFLTGATLKGIRQRFPGILKAEFSRSILREIFSFALPAFLAGMLVGPAYWWANTLLARGSGFEQVGLFGVAFALFQMIMVIPSSLSVPAVSFMSETYASQEPGAFSGIVSANVRIIWALTLPLSLGCALFAPWIVRLAFGPAYGDAAPLAAIMSFVALIVAVGCIPGNAVAGSGRMWHAFWINGFWLIAFVMATLLLVPAWGAVGLSAAFIVSYVLLAIALSAYSVVMLRVRFKGAMWLGLLTFVSAVVAFVLFRAHLSLSLAAVALAAEAILVLTEWRVVLTLGERSGLIEFSARVLRFQGRLKHRWLLMR